MRLVHLAALVLMAGCRPTGPFDVELTLIGAPLPDGVSCPGLTTTLSGFDCVDGAGSCVIARPVEAVAIHLELIELPESALGERVPEILGRCRDDAPCTVHPLGAPFVIACRTGSTAAECLVRELGDLSAMSDAALGPIDFDVRGVAQFRLVVSDASPGCTRSDLGCVLGCAYTLPLVVGSGPVEATLALDASGGCGPSALRACAGFAGVP